MTAHCKLAPFLLFSSPFFVWTVRTDRHHKMSRLCLESVSSRHVMLHTVAYLKEIEDDYTFQRVHRGNFILFFCGLTAAYDQLSLTFFFLHTVEIITIKKLTKIEGKKITFLKMADVYNCGND